MLLQDEAVVSCISIAVSRENIGLKEMRDRFRKLLKHFALDIRLEALNEHHRVAVRFIRSSSTKITQELFSKPFVGDHFPGPPAHDKSIGPHENSDQDSTDEEPDEEELYDDSPRHFDQLKQFILESAAYRSLRQRLHEFVYPNLGSKLRSLLKSWSKHDHKYHLDIDRYNLSNLAAELQYIRPHRIRVDCKKKTGQLTRMAGYCQNMVEHWTGERWDWWPLPRCPRPFVIKANNRAWIIRIKFSIIIL
ncbi:hypothetical protein F4781DRAFT_414220 [Annulohypoxylon bovei var. microspora]|nr:hypothetical protein F4781DRAFT_414220 [Annulohypoxylon bovei var. microspora]